MGWVKEFSPHGPCAGSGNGWWGDWLGCGGLPGRADDAAGAGVDALAGGMYGAISRPRGGSGGVTGFAATRAGASVSAAWGAVQWWDGMRRREGSLTPVVVAAAATLALLALSRFAVAGVPEFKLIEAAGCWR